MSITPFLAQTISGPGTALGVGVVLVAIVAIIIIFAIFASRYTKVGPNEVLRSEEHTLNSSHSQQSRMPSSA